MQRRRFLAFALGGLGASMAGCRGTQFGRVIKPGDTEMVGSHKAGGETYKPLVDEAVAKLLARHGPSPHTMASHTSPPIYPKRICFVCVENKTSEEMGDFKDQLYQHIDSRILESGVFQSVSKRYVDAGLSQVRIRPDQLFVPDNMRTFVAIMEQQGQPFDFLLYATVTSGTTQENKDYQRDYLLTLELVHVQSGQHDKQSAMISKGYHQSRLGRLFK
jgi:hypothetical protein